MNEVSVGSVLYLEIDDGVPGRETELGRPPHAICVGDRPMAKRCLMASVSILAGRPR